MPQTEQTTWTSEQLGEEVGAELFRKLIIAEPPDAYQRNALPPIDEAFHTEELIAELQKPAMKIE